MAVKRTNNPAFSGFLTNTSATLDPAGDWTACGWVKFVTSVNTCGIWSCGDGTDAFFLETNGTGGIKVRQGLSFSFTTRFTSSNEVSTDVWYFIAVTKSGSTITLYRGDETNAAVSVGSGDSSGWGTPLYTAGGQRLMNGRGDGNQLGTDSEIAYWRSWDGVALSVSDLNVERASATAVYTTPRTDWRLTSSAARATDSSSNSFSLSDGAGTTWADGVDPTLPSGGIPRSMLLGAG